MFTSAKLSASWLDGFQDTEGCKALPPILSSWRLRHAIEPNGFAAQFPHDAGLCNRELLDAVEEAATKPGRRTLPASAPVAASPAPPPPPVPQAQTVPKAAAPVGTSASPRPASPTKAGRKGFRVSWKSKVEGKCKSVWNEHLVGR